MPDLWQSVCLFVYIIPHNFLFVKSFYEKFQIIFVFPFYPVSVSRKAERNIHNELRKKVFRFFSFRSFACRSFFVLFAFVAFRCFWSHFHRFVIIQCRVLNLSAVFVCFKIFDNSLTFFALFAYFCVK